GHVLLSCGATSSCYSRRFCYLSRRLTRSRFFPYTTLFRSNYPEAVILGIGRIAEKPVVRNGEVVVAPVLALSLSFDHRIVDGATGQEALNQIKRLLNDPQLIMMEA